MSDLCPDDDHVPDTPGEDTGQWSTLGFLYVTLAKHVSCMYDIMTVELYDVHMSDILSRQCSKQSDIMLVFLHSLEL